MRPNKLLVACLIVCCLAGFAAPRAAARGGLKLNGLISLESYGERPRFSVRLHFPKSANKPTVVTITNSDGWYEFAGLDAGRYLLEVYQGDQMVYQQVVTLDGGRHEHRHDIKLKAR